MKKSSKERALASLLIRSLFLLTLAMSCSGYGLQMENKKEQNPSTEGLKTLVTKSYRDEFREVVDALVEKYTYDVSDADMPTIQCVLGEMVQSIKAFASEVEPETVEWNYIAIMLHNAWKIYLRDDSVDYVYTDKVMNGVKSSHDLISFIEHMISEQDTKEYPWHTLGFYEALLTWMDHRSYGWSLAHPYYKHEPVPESTWRFLIQLFST